MQEAKAQVTILLSMVMVCVFSLLCCLVESARTAGARWYLQTAASSALDSVFSQYHRQLWDSYRLLFAEYEDEEELEVDYASFLNPYLEAAKWFPMQLDSMEVEGWNMATDDNGAYFEQEILDYMKYGKWNLNFGAGTKEELFQAQEGAGAVKRIAEKYRGHAKDALKLEKALEAISANQEIQRQKKEQGLSALKSYDCGGFCRVGESLVRELEKVPGLVRNYQKQADALAAKLRDSRKLYEQEKAGCKDQVQSALEQEIAQYEAYVNEDGKRRRETEALAGLSVEQAALVAEVMEEAREVEEIIEDWDDDDDEDSEEPDLEVLWSPVIRHFEQLEIRTLSFRHGVKDKKKEGWLKKVESMYQSGLLRMVLPEGMEVSGKILETAELPTETGILTKGARGISLYDHLLVNEYCGKFFRCFRTGLPGAENEGAKPEEAHTGEKAVDEEVGVPGKEGIAYEMEYLISGADSDESNLTQVVHKLLAVREGLNLTYLLSDGQKRVEAQNLAMAITGITGVAPLVYLTTFFILSVWALGEALMDIRGLLAGKRVPLWKSSETWTLSLGGLLSMGQDGKAETGGGDQGLLYISWLKLLLFVGDIVVQEYRMMDMIQMNIRRKQNSFRMRRGMYRVQLKSRLRGRHVFFALGVVEKRSGGGEYGYSMEVEAERVY